MPPSESSGIRDDAGEAAAGMMLSAYELARERRIAENRRVMEEMVLSEKLELLGSLEKRRKATL